MSLWTGAACVAAAGGATGLALFLRPARVHADPAATPPERFTSPVSRAVYHVRRDASGHEKWLVGADGRRFESVRAVIEAETLALPPLARALDADLLAAATDPARADEMVDVTVVFRRQPAFEAAERARERHDASLASDLGESRRILGRIASERTATDGGPADVGTARDDEERLLTPDEKSRLREIRARVAATLAAMRREVMAEATPIVADDQAAFRAFVAEQPGGIDFGGSVTLNAASAHVPAGSLRALAERFPEILRVAPLGHAEANLDVATATVGAGSWWSHGYDGSSSTIVGVIDTGIDSSHPAFSGGVVVGGATFHTTAKLNLVPPNQPYGDNSSTTDDIQGHGTPCAGVVASNDSTYRGIAYGAKILNAKAGYRTSTGGAYIMLPDARAGGDWALTNGATVLSLSFGDATFSSGANEMSLFLDGAADSLFTQCAVSAGNGGPNAASMSGIAGTFNALVVGASDDANSTSRSDDVIVGSSGRGPTSDNRLKPDLVAPGANILSTNSAWEGAGADFVSMSGTSMSTPLVAGGLAVLQDAAAAAYPQGYRALVINNLWRSATSPDASWGRGMLDLGAAYTNRAALVEGTLTAAGPRWAIVRASALASGSRVTLCWNRHVTSNGAAIPTVYYAPLDLDLYVYDEATGAALGSSASANDDVEQATLSAASSSPIIKVYRAAAAFPSGFSTERFGVATESAAATTIETPPTPTCTFEQLAPYVAAGATIQAQVRVANAGTVRAKITNVTLTPPSGYTILAGTNPRQLGDITPGSDVLVTWTLLVGSGPSATKTYGAAATSTCYGETFEGPNAAPTQVLDADPPIGPSVRFSVADTFINSADAPLTLAAYDALSGVGEHRLRLQGDAWGPWTAFDLGPTFTLTGADGTKTVEAQFRDRVGNVSATASASIVKDTTAPTGSIKIESGAPYITGTSVTLTLTASDASTGVASMRVADEAAAFGAWQPFAGTASWQLPAGPDGPRTVKAQFKDVAGNESQTYTATIVVDRGAPEGTVHLLGDAAATNATHVKLNLEYTDGLSGVAFMRFSSDDATWTPWTPAAPTATWTLVAAEGVRVVFAQFQDGAGNVSASTSDSIFLDLTPPVGTYVLGADLGYFMPWETISATVSGTDAPTNGSGVKLFRWSYDAGKTWSAWAALSVASSADVTRPVGVIDALAVVTGEIGDGAGNPSEPTARNAFLVGPDAPDLALIGTIAGTVGVDGDVDAFRVGLVAGEQLSLSTRSAKSNVKRGKFGVAFDVYLPNGARAVTGSLPSGLSRPAVKGFKAATTGEHWIVLRGTGRDRDLGGSYLVDVKHVLPKSSVRAGKSLPDAASVVSVPFEAAEGAVLTATLSGVAGPPTLVRPDGTTVELPTKKIVKGRTTVPAFQLLTATGSYRLDIPAAAADKQVVYRVALAQPKRQKLADQ